MGRKFTIFALFYFVFEGKFQVQAPRGAYIRRGDLTEGFLRYDFEGLIFGGAYTWRGLFSGILRYDYNCYMRNNNYYTLKKSSNDAAEKLRKYSSRIHLYVQSLQRIIVILITHFTLS